MNHRDPRTLRACVTDLIALRQEALRRLDRYLFMPPAERAALERVVNEFDERFALDTTTERKPGTQSTQLD